MLQLWRVMLAGGRNFMRNAWLSTAATAVMTITLSIIIISFISNSALTSTIKGVTDKIDISIFLNDSVTQEQREHFEKVLRSDPNVLTTSYTSKDQAVAAYRASNIGDKSIEQALNITGSKALPASIQVKVKDPKKLDQVIAFTKQSDLAKLLDPEAPPTYTGQNKNNIDKIISISNFFKSSGLIASIFFVIVSTLIIFNTIRMAIFTRKEEIEIMKLVGATKWFIRGPFLFEASLYGIVAAVIAATISYSLLLGAGPKLAAYIDVKSTIEFFRTYPVFVILGELVIGVFIGVLSSLLAMSRYLKL